PPVELLPALPPVVAVPLADGGGDRAVVVLGVLPSQRKLPADVGLEIERPLVALEGSPVQRAPRPAGETRPVEEDARVVGQPADGVPLLVRLHHTVLQALVPELP